MLFSVVFGLFVVGSALVNNVTISNVNPRRDTAGNGTCGALVEPFFLLSLSNTNEVSLRFRLFIFLLSGTFIV